MTRHLILSVVLIVALSGCLVESVPSTISITPFPIHTPIPTATACPTPPPALTVRQAKNATFVAAWDPGARVELVDGQYTGEPFIAGAAERPVVTLVDPVALGDLNADGWGDAAVILAFSGGGSGRFYSLDVLLNDNGEPLHVASLLLGDRIQVEVLEYQETQIVLRAFRHSPDDPLCCPSQLVETRYELGENGLVEIARQNLEEPTGLTLAD